ncbi:MAG: AAA family ATPase [Candidatus Brocadiae bacterium]|nr:AAA family ATPase [Candidatus Brocadiia bacterium]
MGILKSFFKQLKAAEKTLIGKMFITGVSPIVMPEISSGFNRHVQYGYAKPS